MYKPDDKLKVTWTEVAVEKFEQTCTAQELAELIDCPVEELAEVLANNDHELYDLLGEWQEEGGILADLQREDIRVVPVKEKTDGEKG